MVMILRHSVTIFAMSCVCKDSLKFKNYGHDFVRRVVLIEESYFLLYLMYSEHHQYKLYIKLAK